MCCRYVNEYMDTNLRFRYIDGARNFLSALCACKHVCMHICKVGCTYVYIFVRICVSTYVCCVLASST